LSYEWGCPLLKRMRLEEEVFGKMVKVEIIFNF